MRVTDEAGERFPAFLICGAGGAFRVIEAGDATYT